MVADQNGAFVYRSGDGIGDVNWSDIQLRWNYRDDGVDDNALVDVQVFAIEMVYVPESAFSIGTGFGGTEIDKFFTLIQLGQFFLQQPYLVSAEAPITISNTAGNLYYDSTVSGGDQLEPISADFPKGFGAFYCMKYEVSQDQWIGFFNTLTQTQKVALDITGPSGKNSDDEFIRNANYIDTNGATSGPKRGGVFAASALLNNREETGGSYYRIMELTGNVYERAVSVGNPEGRAFTGLHGDGTILTNETYNVANWPLDTGEGFGYRGGAYPNQIQFLHVSDRNDDANSFSGSNGRIGFRGGTYRRLIPTTMKKLIVLLCCLSQLLWGQSTVEWCRLESALLWRWRRRLCQNDL